MHVNVKWNKQVFENVEVDLEQAPLVFKMQIFTLSGVPPERQKVMIKAKLLGDDSWESVGTMRNGQTVLVMGTAETEAVVQLPKELPQFAKDGKEYEEIVIPGLTEYGAGLQNLGNTCYMNSTLQLLYSVPELREKLIEYDVRRSSGNSGDVSTHLTAAAGALFREMNNENAASAMPLRFLTMLRSRYPQFAEKGRNGLYRQQDAEECFTQFTQTLSETVKVNPQDSSSKAMISDLFGIDLVTKLTSEETDESITLNVTSTTLKCNIPQTPPVHHVHEGIVEGLRADRSQRSSRTGQDVLFKGNSEIVKLSPYLVIHMIRFTFRIDTQKKAKILRKVSFPTTMDLYEFCSAEYKAQLDNPRKKAEELRNKEIEKEQGQQKTADAKDESSNGTTADQMDVEAAQATSSEQTTTTHQQHTELTGRYHLHGVLTHKGREADSGHYIAWVRQKDNQWVQFDDEEMNLAREEDVLSLCGGGDWHMSYLLLYKAEVIDMDDLS